MKAKIYKTYMFRDKDPVIDEMRTAYQDNGSPSFHTIAELSGMSPTTMYNWFHGTTKRPQNATIMAFMGTLGYTRKWVQTKKPKL